MSQNQYEPRSFCLGYRTPMSDATPVEPYGNSDPFFGGYTPVLQQPPGQFPPFLPSYRGSPVSDHWVQGFSGSAPSPASPPVPPPMHFAPGAGDRTPQPGLQAPPAPMAFGASGDRRPPMHSAEMDQAADAVPDEIAAMTTALPQMEGLSKAEIAAMLRSAAADAAWED